MERLIIRNSHLVNKKAEVNREGLVNKKANTKMDVVVNIYESSLNEYWDTEYNGFLYKNIRLNNLRYLTYLEMSYILKDRLFSRSYNLTFNYEIPAFFSEHIKINLRYSGRTKIKDAYFEVIEGGEKASLLIETLNHQLISYRLVSLELINLTLEYSPNRKSWHVFVESLIGSTTWNLIPPVMQVIKPNPTECMFMIELFELIAGSLQNE